LDSALQSQALWLSNGSRTVYWLSAANDPQPVKLCGRDV
jgi:hypothetical protein